MPSPARYLLGQSHRDCPMKHVLTAGEKALFTPLLKSRQVQAATMVLAPDESSSEEIADEHPASEQWLFVVSGTGRAKFRNRRSLSLKPGSLLLIEKNEPHQITNTGRVPLVTINFYAPPAYTSEGDVLQRARGIRPKNSSAASAPDRTRRPPR